MATLALGPAGPASAPHGDSASLAAEPPRAPYPAGPEAGRRWGVTPYADNYAVFEPTDRPARDGTPLGTRLALHFQFSQGFPVWYRHTDMTGAYFAMTFRGLFDIFDRAESSPVWDKTFMPDAFGLLDANTLGDLFPGTFLDWGCRPGRSLFQAGIQHESNGQYQETSRAIDFKPYLAWRFRFASLLPWGRLDRLSFQDQEANALTLRATKLIGTHDNPGIFRSEGFLDGELLVQNLFYRVFGWEDPRQGNLGLELWAAPGGVFGGPWLFPRFSLAAGLFYTPAWWWQHPLTTPQGHIIPYILNDSGLDLTLYLRFWTGYNEFLLEYDRRTTVPISFGFLHRM